MSRQREIIDEAQRLAELLPGVKPSALQSLVSSYDGNTERLRRLMELAAAGDGGHSQRGQGYGEQVIAVSKAVATFLGDTQVAPAILPAVFGWTVRLLRVREAFGSASWEPDGSSRPQRSTNSPAAGGGKGSKRREGGEQKPAIPGNRSGRFKTGLGGSNLAELAKFRLDKD